MKNCEAVKVAEELARVLSRGKRKKRAQRAWIPLLRRLLEEEGSEQVWSVLRWLADHLGEKWVPTVYSARSFVDKFDRIVQAKRRIEKRGSDRSVRVTKEAKAISKMLGEIDWGSAGNRQDELRAIQKSLNVTRSIIERLRNVVRHGSVTDAGLANWLLSRIGSPRDFVYDWFVTLARVSVWWEEGWRLENQYVRLDSDRFWSFIRPYAEEYFGRRHDWRERLESLLGVGQSGVMQ